ncbi:SusD/RagB family nutrient-binding outer membrane lipoprotein [Aequorivita sp. H23M31]|uniref:SusD/RagB family nutrient-binding outer membrane lipoprotein n=2 Tax=Aequorivita ciconiae TaxID=2494375 RepID=A0A410G7F8_9FLAO|nr:SusD/RagB family nutrient-binding outer membrane lipoprotein [Aequorivita sp. H23M31]
MNDNLILSGRKDYVAARTIIEKMKELDDPRIEKYFAGKVDLQLGEVVSVTTSGTTTTITFKDKIGLDPLPVVGVDEAYLQGPDGRISLGVITAMGEKTIDIENITQMPAVEDIVTVFLYKGGSIGKPSPYAGNVKVNPRLTDPTEPGVLLSFVEVEFLKAEAAARGGYNIAGTAKEYYDAAITASFEFWGAEGLADYLANPLVDYDTAIANSTSDPKWKEVIGTQAWLGLYNRTFAAWLSVRRLDYPILTKPASAESGFPVRYTYPAQEQTLNTTSYNAAASAIGGDTPETRLFWDKYYTFDF